MKLEGLDMLVRLRELYVSHNGIERLEGLEYNVSAIFAPSLIDRDLYIYECIIC